MAASHITKSRSNSHTIFWKFAAGDFQIS